jgi:hypothetical protein
MDCLSGLEKFFMEEFPNAKLQRHQACGTQHSDKGSSSMRKEVSDRLRDIFYASSR